MTASAVAPAVETAGDWPDVQRPRVLIAFGSRNGGTADIARWIAAAMEADGLDVVVRPAGNVRSVAAFDAVVLGGALYANRWHADARRFVRRHARRLRGRPVWLFSSGPLDASADDHEIPAVRGVQELLTRVGARGHYTFGGRLTSDAKGFPAHAMAKKHAGDWRDPDHIRRVANEIADALVPASHAAE